MEAKRQSRGATAFNSPRLPGVLVKFDCVSLREPVLVIAQWHLL